MPLVLIEKCGGRETTDTPEITITMTTLIQLQKQSESADIHQGSSSPNYGVVKSAAFLINAIFVCLILMSEQFFCQALWTFIVE